MINEFNSILEVLQKFSTEDACIKHLEVIRWEGNVISPFDPTSKVYVCKGNKYKCKNTGKYFNVRTGTIFEDTKIPLQKWFIALYLFSAHKKGISSHQLARDLDITQKTAWFVLHRLRYAFDHPIFKDVMGGDDGIIEIDETYVVRKEKNKHKSKKVEKTKGRSSETKTPVLGLIERKGNVSVTAIPAASRDHFMPVIQSKVANGANIVTDRYPAYYVLDMFFQHRVIEYVNGTIHTNTIEGFWSYFKRGVIGIYHQVSPKHLQSYLDEFALRYNARRMMDSNRFNLVLTNMVRRLTYKDLIA